MRRWTGLAAGVSMAAMAMAFVAGCSAGQITQTDQQVPAVPGAQANAQGVGVRNVYLVYAGPEGYQPGDTAPVEVRIVNDTARPIVVQVSSPDAEGVSFVRGSAASEPPPQPSPSPSPESPSASPSVTGSPGGTASPSPSPRPTTSPRPAGPVEIEIPPASLAVFSQTAVRGLALVGLKKAVRTGETVQIVFTVVNGPTLTVDAVVAPPLTPLPRSPLVIEESGHA
jgi:hypothetical protein